MQEQLGPPFFFLFHNRSEQHAQEQGKGMQRSMVTELDRLSYSFRQQGGKNRRRGKNENEGVKRELIFKEEGQGTFFCAFPIEILELTRFCFA